MPPPPAVTSLHRYPGHHLTTGCQSRARRRSYRKFMSGRLARLPPGPIPAAVQYHRTWAEMLRRRMTRHASRIGSVCIFVAILGPAAFADQIVQTYLAAKVDAPPNTQLAATNTSGFMPVFGTETFDTRPVGTSTTAFTSDFGTNGAVSGAFSGNYTISAPNQYGAAGGTGRFITTSVGTAGLDIKFTTTKAPGLNYFGLWVSALDSGNTVTLKRKGTALVTYGQADVIKAVGACPTNNGRANAYCGNPTVAFQGQNGGEQYAFVNFFDLSGYFDELLVTETSGGGFEADNFTVGYVDTGTYFGTSTTVPEPSSLPVLLAGLLGLAGMAAWRRVLGGVAVALSHCGAARWAWRG